ncbi:hypothetical protein E2C01_015870 [Portunus trituberculatus]|uniref:Uncharacterized protein n=1 Tax=Portunus trituberculatus TaxID=210409 RepID=A0A5B7DPE6_PORTR|nr:hypothetical protein [Portunus trituberculatus]
MPWLRQSPALPLGPAPQPGITLTAHSAAAPLAKVHSVETNTMWDSLTCTAITFWRVSSALWHGGRANSCSEMGGSSSPVRALTHASEASLILVLCITHWGLQATREGNVDIEAISITFPHLPEIKPVAYLSGCSSTGEKAPVIIAVHGDIEDVTVIIEHGLCAIAVMNVLLYKDVTHPVHNEDFLQIELLVELTSSDGNGVEETEPHGLLVLCMVPWRTDQRKPITQFTLRNC